MATLRELKTRIGSVSSSEKITGAMKMISSAKVHKSELALRRLLPYRKQISSIMGHLLEAGTDFSSPLIAAREVKRVGVVVFGSDDGLCGAYNINIFKRLLGVLNGLRDKYGRNTPFVIWPVGSKIAKPVGKLAGNDIEVRTIEGVDSKMEGDVVNDFTRTLQDAFCSGEVDELHVLYMSFKSMSRQVLTSEQLFPVVPEALQTAAGNSTAASRRKADENALYLFEPDPNSIFNAVLPMFILSTMQEVTIENRASEQAARVMAMQSANDNAKKLLESLQLEFNKLRQQSITTELLDIVGGQIGR